MVQKKIIRVSLYGMAVSLIAAAAMFAGHIHQGGWFSFGADLALGIFSGLIVSLATGIIFYFDERKRFDLELCGIAAEASNNIAEFYSMYTLDADYGDIEGCFEGFRKLRADFTAMHNTMVVREYNTFYTEHSKNKETIDRFLAYLLHMSELSECMLKNYYELMRPGLRDAEKKKILMSEQFRRNEQCIGALRETAKQFIRDFSSLAHRKADSRAEQ